MNENQIDRIKQILPVILFFLFWIIAFPVAFFYNMFTLFEMSILSFILTILTIQTLWFIVYLNSNTKPNYNSPSAIAKTTSIYEREIDAPLPKEKKPEEGWKFEREVKT